MSKERIYENKYSDTSHGWLLSRAVSMPERRREMKKTAFFFVVALMTASLAMAVKPAGAFENKYPYAEVCLKNLTGLPVYYSFRWGTSGPWEAREVAPGDSHWHTYTYPIGSRVSPNLYVKFNSSLANGGGEREYVLDRYAVREQSCALGKGYSFVSDGNAIDLKPDE